MAKANKWDTVHKLTRQSQFRNLQYDGIKVSMETKGVSCEPVIAGQKK